MYSSTGCINSWHPTDWQQAPPCSCVRVCNVRACVRRCVQANVRARARAWSEARRAGGRAGGPVCARMWVVRACMRSCAAAHCATTWMMSNLPLGPSSGGTQSSFWHGACALSVIQLDWRTLTVCVRGRARGVCVCVRVCAFVCVCAFVGVRAHLHAGEEEDGLFRVPVHPHACFLIRETGPRIRNAAPHLAGASGTFQEPTNE